MAHCGTQFQYGGILSKMKVALFHVGRKLNLINGVKNIILVQRLKRSIMTSQTNMEKALDELKLNPYFEKYAKKISKLQETSPEEFLSKIEAKEREAKAKKEALAQERKFQPASRAKPTLGGSIRRYYSNGSTSNFYVTTPIFYVNAGPHIGHLYSAVLADAVARYNSMLGHSVRLTTGTDEHGNKVQQAAQVSKLPMSDYCSKISLQFHKMCEVFDVGYTEYIRTTQERHLKTLNHFWITLRKKDYIYPGTYSGWYCVPDEAFLSTSQLEDRKNANGETVKVSIESGHPVEWAEEDNYKFRLSVLQNDLKHWLKDENTVRPAKFHKILSEWIEEGSCLEDLSISRPIDRVSWGVPVPDDNTQSIYVWLDALVNYLTALGYPEESYKEFWPPNIQVIGKDILKFHGVYWPAFLIAAGLEPPRSLLCHSHWTVDGQKMSKSKGNVVSPFDAAESYTADGLRYFLLREAVPYSDANYSKEKVFNTVNSELADSLGNLVSRCTGKAVNPGREIPHPGKYVDILKSESATKLKYCLETLHLEARDHYEKNNLHHVVDSVMSTVHAANQMVEFHKPWHLRKQTDDQSYNELQAVLSLALDCTRISGLILYPIVPKLSNNLLELLDVPENERSWANTVPRHLTKSENSVRKVNAESTILFKRIRN
ncbi:methionine--tRNA ligase, mitochondrial isoform X2 [Athalia rosae]|uniref:methionine--tRNA ligase, mitochondrial isoform X2 n=1 Tax=Athalia rosae TaxID=37344 RepID=UPI00203409C6|nr:methionine--tRNA ligase, mitochondrial isoform X2 [Athalia rosae]